MRRPSAEHRCRAAGRAGFSLVELLVVVGILALLAGIVITVVRGVVGNARAAATKATIRKIDGLLMKRVAAFDRYCDGQDKLAPSAPPAYVRQTVNPQVYNTVLAGFRTLMNRDPAVADWSDPTIRPVLLLLARKAYFLQSFPQSLAELNRHPSWQADEQVQKVVAGSETEHGEVFYLSLTRLDSFGVEADDIDQFKSNDLVDADGNGIPQFVDGWGNPIRFYRWPTRLARPVLSTANYSQAQSLNGNDMTPHDQWSYAHTIPVGVAYDSAGASFQLLISAGPGSNNAPTRGSGALLADEHQDPLGRDPADTRNRLHPSDTLGVTYSYWNAFVSWMEQNLHTMDTYHVPLLVSAGQDKTLGLLEPTDTTNFGHVAQPDMAQTGALLDAITNRNLTAGGK